MMDITKIDKEMLSMLAGAYLHAAYHFGIEPVDASEKKQRRIRRWIKSQYTESVRVFAEFADIFSLSNSDRDVLLCLKACLDLERAMEKEKEDQFETDFAAVDEASKSALKQLLQFHCWQGIKRVGNDIQIFTEDTSAYRRLLTLKNADGEPQGQEGCICRNLEMKLKKEENRFCFSGELEDPIEETVTNFALTFESTEVETEVFNACGNLTFWEDPWDFLCRILWPISLKAELPGDYCNGKEKELLPLIREILAIENWYELPEQACFSFVELKKLTTRYDYVKAESLLTKLETIKPRENDFHKYLGKLRTALCQKQHAPMWREIYSKILESQSEYENKVEALCDKDLLANTRNGIQAILESKGYTGTYPDFVKKGALRGIHLEQSYQTTYFVGMEKRVRYHIHCLESFDENDDLSIQFISGTALLKKDEKETDIFDCLFNANGRRFFHTLEHAIPLHDRGDTESASLETAVTIAVKKAECVRLNKAERQAFYGEMLPSWGGFCLVFLIGGGLFGIVMTLFMLLLSILITAAFGLFSEIPKMLRTMPWGMLLAISWIGFGGAMGIAEALARRK